MPYTIEIDYTTGDSFGSHEARDEVGCVWEDKEQAQLALSYIREHYAFYQSLQGWNRSKTEKQVFQEVKKQPWFDPEFGEYWQYGLSLPCADGKQHVSAFWTGYFERLNGAKIIALEDDLDSFTI